MASASQLRLLSHGQTGGTALPGKSLVPSGPTAARHTSTCQLATFKSRGEVLVAHAFLLVAYLGGQHCILAVIHRHSTFLQDLAGRRAGGREALGCLTHIPLLLHRLQWSLLLVLLPCPWLPKVGSAFCVLDWGKGLIVGLVSKQRAQAVRHSDTARSAALCQIRCPAFSCLSSGFWVP